MPGLIQETPYKHITVKELAPTFVAEVQGVDFSKPIEPDVFQEIRNAMAKVSLIRAIKEQSLTHRSTEFAFSGTLVLMTRNTLSFPNSLATSMILGHTSPMAGSLNFHITSSLMLEI